MISTVGHSIEKILNISHWKIRFHDSRLKLFQIRCLPELYFSYEILEGKKR